MYFSIKFLSLYLYFARNSGDTKKKGLLDLLRQIEELDIPIEAEWEASANNSSEGTDSTEGKNKSWISGIYF